MQPLGVFPWEEAKPLPPGMAVLAGHLTLASLFNGNSLPYLPRNHDVVSVLKKHSTKHVDARSTPLRGARASKDLR